MLYSTTCMDIYFVTICTFKTFNCRNHLEIVVRCIQKKCRGDIIRLQQRSKHSFTHIDVVATQRFSLFERNHICKHEEHRDITKLVFTLIYFPF